MDSDNFVKLTPKKLFLRCAVPAMITSVFGALFSIAFLSALIAKGGLTRVWLMPTAAGIASAILTLILAYTLNSSKDSE